MLRTIGVGYVILGLVPYIMELGKTLDHSRHCKHVLRFREHLGSSVKSFMIDSNIVEASFREVLWNIRIGYLFWYLDLTILTRLSRALCSAL